MTEVRSTDQRGNGFAYFRWRTLKGETSGQCFICDLMWRIGLGNGATNG